MKRPIIQLIFVTTIFSISVSFFIAMAHEIFRESEDAFDNAVLDYVTIHLPSGRLAPAMTFITFFASGYFLTVFYLGLFIYVLVTNRLIPALYIVCTGLSGFLVNALLKMLFRRERPSDPLLAPLSDFSFPSGHSSAAFIFYGLLIYLLWQTQLRTKLKYLLAGFLVFFSLTIGFSRIYLRMHYATDVLAGFCVGIAWLSLSFLLYNHSIGRFADKDQEAS